MGRPRKWASDADRKKADRGNGKEPEAFSDEEIVPVEPGSSPLQPFPKNRPAPSLESYVAEAVEGARLEAQRQLDRKLFAGMSGSEAAADIESRVAKAESYARWRWTGYRDGEIVSL